MSFFSLAHTDVRIRVRACVSQLVRTLEKLGGFLIGVAPDGDLAGRDQVADRLVSRCA